MKLSIPKVFVLVTVSALAGMVLAGAFGYAAAHISPELFSTLILWSELEPVGAATVLGAMVGVVLGGGLGVFAVMIQLIGVWVAQRNRPSVDG